MSARRGLRLAALIVFALLIRAGAQERPHVGFLFPAGVQQGESVTMIIGGESLEGATNAHVTGSGVTLKFVSFSRDLDKKALRQLNDRKINAEQRLAHASNAVERAEAEKDLDRAVRQISYAESAPTNDTGMMRFMQETQSKKQLNPQLVDRVRIEVRASPQAVPGLRELRLMTARGLSEPLTFMVGTMPEQLEREPNDLKHPMRLGPFPAAVNGQIMPGDTDGFRFTARRGQTLVCAVQARSLMPYLADAVPGWFQAVVTLYDAAGREVAFADDWHQNPDPLLVYTVPADGDYRLEIRDSIYRGREDFVYRIALGELPFVTGVFPLGGPADRPTKLQLSGFNLAGVSNTVTPRIGEPGVVSLAAQLGVQPDPLLFQTDDLPEFTEDAGASSKAQPVKTPVVINGRIDQPGDEDTFRFSGRAGDTLIAEVYARRLGSPLDSVLRLLDARGQVVAANDDHVDPSFGLVTHHADSYIACTLPADGAYDLVVREAQNKGGELYAYRLRVSPPRPDFKLRVTPSCAQVPRGGDVPLVIHAKRTDGFAGDIAIGLENVPAGFSLSGGLLRGTNNEVRVTVHAPVDTGGREFQPALVGRAVIDGRTVRRRARPAEDMMQAFAYRHMVPSEDFILTLGPWKVPALIVALDGTNVARLAAGRETALPLRSIGKVKSKFAGQAVQLELDAPPAGITVVKTREATETQAGAVVVQVDPAAIKPGACGNLIFRAFPTESVRKDGKAGQKRNALFTLPAVPFEIVP